MAAGAATAMAAAAAAAAPACVGGAIRAVTASSSSSSFSSSTSRLLPAGKCAGNRRCSLLFPIWKSAGNRKCSSCQGFSPSTVTRAPRASALDNENQPQSVPSAASTAPETLLKSLSLAVPEGKVERDVSTKAVADEAAEGGVAEGGESEGSEPTIASLPRQSDIDKKLKKKAELRRKRLKRKRMLRKKGRWPPSKMAKLKNV
ncbi:hypothetical protein CBR_g19021 [Chara braunii]|uniref:Uncharacterized protein n=1 Tax=Chara braunii TaxID=69332 RepID=A0A388KX28_CHABU|nr:hypothetical protein CBR_g19021 [Chara braunii]|eukprot:GBG74614.1 hypothetical protein CBR_g19021 [Chara braunii]